MPISTQRCHPPAVPARVRAISRRPRRWGSVALVAGTIVVENAGAVPAGAIAPGNGSGGTGPGSITLYRPGATGDARPEAVITNGIDTPSGMTFDAAGDLWVGNVGTGTVVEYSRASLTQSSPAPSRTIDVYAYSVAFDPSGDLWVANGSNIVWFTKAQLGEPGQPVPGIYLVGDCDVSFDRSGDLWAGSGEDFVSEYSRAALARGSHHRPPR